MATCVHCEGCWGPRPPQPLPQASAEGVLAADSSQLSLSLQELSEAEGNCKTPGLPSSLRHPLGNYWGEKARFISTQKNSSSKDSPLGWPEASVATASERERQRQTDTETEGLQGPVAHHPTLLSFIFSCLELCASVHFFICLRVFLKYFSQTVAWISGWYFFFNLDQQEVFCLALVFFKCLRFPLLLAEAWHPSLSFSFVINVFFFILKRARGSLYTSLHLLFKNFIWMGLGICMWLSLLVTPSVLFKPQTEVFFTWATYHQSFV